MIALHNAVRAVQNRDCNAAIVSGTNLNMGPITTASMTQEGIMSPEGSCKTFDAHADGYGRGEAINAIYIKPLSHAIRDGNPIRAVIRNTGVNQDGQSTGLFATSVVAQEALMRKAYADVGLNPAETAMVEVKTQPYLLIPSPFCDIDVKLMCLCSAMVPGLQWATLSRQPRSETSSASHKTYTSGL